MANNDLFLGLDLGATKISVALVDISGKIMARDRRETPSARGVAAVVEALKEAAQVVMAQGGVVPAQVKAVGLCTPGPIDAVKGVVTHPPNLPGWRDVPLGRLVEEALGKAVFLENDGNAATLGERRFGAGRGSHHMIYVTVSTGIGGGFILNGELYSGATGAAGEIGHMTILPDGPLCGCGNRGCLEALASGTAIARQARERVAGGAPTLMADLVEGHLDRLSAKVVAQAAERGDIQAQEILAEAMNYLGIGMANLVNLFNPQLMVIGGGLSKMGARLFDPVRRVIQERAFPVAAQAAKVVAAELGDDVGVVGAATVAMVRLNKNSP